MAAISDGRYDQVGTFNGNPMTMAAARAMLTEVLTDDAYRQAGARSQSMFDRSMAVAATARRSRVRLRVRLQGLVGLRRDCRHATAASSSPMDTGLSHLHFLVQHNGGVFMAPWGKSEQWTISPHALRRRRRPVLRQRRAVRHDGPLVVRMVTLTSTPPVGSTERATDDIESAHPHPHRPRIHAPTRCSNANGRRSSTRRGSTCAATTVSRPATGSSPMSQARACCW